MKSTNFMPDPDQKYAWLSTSRQGQFREENIISSIMKSPYLQSIIFCQTRNNTYFEDPFRDLIIFEQASFLHIRVTIKQRDFLFGGGGQSLPYLGCGSWHWCRLSPNQSIRKICIPLYLKDSSSTVPREKRQSEL